jgi:hypothetical protein
MAQLTCNVAGCSTPRVTRTLCETHAPRCAVEGCEQRARSRGWCHPHYDKWHDHGSTDANPRRTRSQCKIDDCDTTAVAQGLCPKHYDRWRRHGTTDDPTSRKPPCAVADCGRLAYTRGWCSRHYWSWRKYGDPLIAKSQSRKTATRLPEQAPSDVQPGKVCPRCSRRLALSGFHKRSSRGTRLASWCKDCVRDRYNDRYADDANFRVTRSEYFSKYQSGKTEVEVHRTKVRRDASKLKSMYGITVEEFEMMSTTQGGVCKICGRPPIGKSRLSVDHEHSTSRRVRGLLCDPCNTGVGMFRDNPELLRGAADYLEKFTGP